MSSLELIADMILERIDSLVAQDVHEQGVPDEHTLLKNDNGLVVPYYAVQFGDIQQQGARNMASTRGDDFVLPFYVQALSGDATLARRLRDRMTDVMLGQTLPYAADVRKRAGGGIYPITSSTGATEAYMAPASFGILIQIVDDVVTP